MKKVVIYFLLCLTISLNAYSFGQNKIQSGDAEWSKIATLHFDIYFQKGEDDFGKAAALMAEEAYYKIKADFKSPIRSRIPIIFYKSRQDFETTNVIYSLLSEGVGGFTESSRNRVAVPFTGSYKELEEVLIHELMHAYVNGLNRQRNRFMNLSGLPFWLQEGLPEFESIQGEDVYNNMFVIDLLINDGIPYLDQVGGYFAYRLGESFLVFINDEYGREKVVELFFALRYNSTANLAFKKVFDLEFREIQKRWKNYLRRKYFADFEKFNIPYEVFTKLTDHEKDGSYMNYAPVFSPDGMHYLYFSNKNIRNEIWMGSSLKLKEKELIVKGEANGKYEEFHFQKNNISWFPEGNRFAFVAKTSYGDKIYVMDAFSQEIAYEILLEDFNSIFEIDVSNDGKKIAFCGQKNDKSDVFVYDLISEEITQITNDHYHDFQPSWSPNDDKIAFTSERTFNSEDKNVFYVLSRDIFYYDINEDAFYQVTDDTTDNDTPFWNKDGDQILFISDGRMSTNYHTIDLNNGKRAQVTKILGGVFTGDLNQDDSELIFSCYYDGGWDIYTKANPLDSLSFEEYQIPQKVKFIDDLFEKIDISDYEYYGKRKRDFQKEAPSFNKKVTAVSFEDFAKEDSLRQIHNEEIDKRPTEKKIPVISDYKTKFALDYVWGGMAYSPSGGTYAQLQMGLSDLMGNHSLNFNLGISGTFDTSDFIFNYLYLAKRIDYGFGAFMLNDEYYYITNFYGTNDYFRERIRQMGLYGIIRYPFNKFWRIDWENLISTTTTIRDWWTGSSWEKEYLPAAFADYFGLEASETETVYAPQLTLVHDNSIFGSTGPISGWRGALLANRSFSTQDSYSILFGDLRSYNFFAKRYSVALRAAGGSIIGDTDSRFDMDYFNGVRGFEYDEDEDLLGKNKVVGSFELRFPFIDRLNFAFPLPLYLYQIRGSAFLDLGAIWTDDLRLTEAGSLEDLMAGIGFGPRLNMGYFVLKFDIAWQTDLESFSKPSYYFTLTPDF
ncbi:MAG: hypothetical protein K9N09_07450 [Candidatus Cloacimonetes bacterium]|nr:hypothetical protein [Candidatus Cloacimonadota bacterium]MCF7813920.1 hypothetical protein [Candidatus Cloacimonadota bacterium]MCF7868517.1 hypothetical protein [Candidatus Cloacimonadota bacterium]MCF7884032.1 hypothetical protein [Candidatus Cloacimonadota bacterium]